MTTTDRRGLELSLDDSDAADAYGAALESFLNYEMAAGGSVKKVLIDDPDFVMATVLRGYMMLMLETVGVQAKVANLSASTLETAEHANDRERLHLQALGIWAGGDVLAAAAVWDRILAEHPLDLLALKMHHYTTFWTGRANVLRSAVEGVLGAWDQTTPGFDHVLGMHAFALNECGRYESGEAIGRRAVELNPEDLWSVHAVAHALEMRGDLVGGEQWFDVPADTWDTKNPFRGHIWWHAALFPYSAGRYDRVMEIYDNLLRPASTDFFLDIQNLASLLCRLELVGVDVGDRWDELADHAAARIGDHVLAFTDVHCCLALAGAGRAGDLAAYVESLRSHKESLPVEIDTSPLDVALPLCEGLGAYGKGDASRAADIMTPLRGELAPIGGSHAQRDVFEQILVEVTHRAGDLDMARHLLGARTLAWPNSVPTFSRYSEVLLASGDGDAADHARERVEEITRR